jgi:hypothetical protein
MLMRSRWILLAAGAAVAGGCSQSSNDQSNAVTNAGANAAAAKKHPTYCFFPDDATKGWTVSRDSKGDVVVTGQAHIEDRRYMAALADTELSGKAASLWLTMVPNTTGMGAQGDWWKVNATIAGSAAVENVMVMCGTKKVASLPVKK